ncbi:MAG TPA: GAF domain-containing protein [Candidatus Angelobacter sp.]
MAEASTLLILLAGAILLYRSFRERYLVPWIAGWTAFGLSRLFIALSLSGPSSQLWLCGAYATYGIAIWLFTAAVFDYVDQKELLWPSAIAVGAGLVVGLLHVLLLPKLAVLASVFYLSWRIVLVVAAVMLMRSAWGRPAFGRWLLASMFLLVHLHFNQATHTVPAQDVLLDLLLGISMMIVVLDGSRVQIQRLGVLNRITQKISDSQDFHPAVDTVLAELMEIAGARAAWFRILEDGKLVLKAHRGLSETFAEQVRVIDTGKSVSGFALRESEVYVLRVQESSVDVRANLRAEGFHHILLVPVEGKNSRIGTLTLGLAHFRAHTEDEKKFLKAAANQLGLAAENRSLLQQVVHSRSEWASTFDSIRDCILVHDRDYRIVRANRSLLNRLGLSRDQVVGQLCVSILPGAGVNWAGCPYCEHSDHAGEEDPCFGGYCVVSTSAYTGEDVSSGGTVHAIKDITEARAAEERYSSLFNHMHEGVFASSPEGKILDCNEAFVHMLGYGNKDQVLALEAVGSLYVHPEDRRKFLDEMALHGFVRNFEYLLRRKDGKEISVIESSFATRGPGGEIERYQGVVLDVTEMKRAEDEIRRRNRELYVLNNIAVTFNQSFDLDEILQLVMLQIVDLLSTDTASVYLFDEETVTLHKKAGYGHRSRLVSENEAFPLPADFVETLRAGHIEIIDHEQLPRLPDSVQAIVDAEGLRSWLWVVLWRKEKMLGALAASSRVPRQFNRSEESVLIAVGRQLATTIEKVQLYHETRKAYDDLRRTQEQLLQSEKMSAVGQLISGVAHELNNPLTAILGYAQLLESEPLDPRVQDFIQKLYKQAQRTQKVVQNLLSFARQHKPSRVHVDLRSVMEDTIALRDYDLKVNNIVVERDFEAVLPSVVADPHQLEQVYLNIINNAADAMMETARGGVLRVRLYSENGHVVSDFHDSGPGMRDAKHVFDPFYTTKGVGKGTGLGLSICYGIVKEHGGEISAMNHPEGGALLQVRLPVAVGERPMSERDRIVARRESTLEGRVLLVDDEEAVLDYEREVLAAAGLSVVTAPSGAKALEHLRQQKFDAVFLDSKIPGEWSSEDVYRWIEQERHELVSRTVLVLSNVSDPGVRAFVDATRIFCLVKPFEVADLLAVARRLLRRARVAASSAS